jgi:orotidine-5'-phosphate decarboxylase
MKRETLIQQIARRQSFLCVGIDPEPERLPAPFSAFENKAEALFEFSCAIVEATRDLCVAYKINTAFFEALGAEGWKALMQTVAFIGKEHFIIADAKRGDIGNTSRLYATAFFKTLGADALTISPYMGHDSVQPFLGFEDKWAIVLALTSNAGSNDFQRLMLEGHTEPLWERIVQTVCSWGRPDNLMFVMGATHPEVFTRARQLAPDHFFLVPGVGAQGGDLEAISHAGLNRDGGLLVNASRSILYASSGHDFAKAAREEAGRLQKAMSSLIQAHPIVG